MKLRRILHATDFSPASRRAFARAVALAKSSGAQLLILHVRSTVVPMIDGYSAATVYEDVQRAGRAYATKELERRVAQARRVGARAESVLMEGAAADGIVRAARGRRADMIVLGTHGRSGLARFLLGSVASRVVAQATCPVLTVRGR
jgi:nucleotide-binding universal stress UspA family protein